MGSVFEKEGTPPKCVPRSHLSWRQDKSNGPGRGCFLLRCQLNKNICLRLVIFLSIFHSILIFFPFKGIDRSQPFWVCISTAWILCTRWLNLLFFWFVFWVSQETECPDFLYSINLVVLIHKQFEDYAQKQFSQRKHMKNRKGMENEPSRVYIGN